MDWTNLFYLGAICDIWIKSLFQFSSSKENSPFIALNFEMYLRVSVQTIKVESGLDAKGEPMAPGQ